VIAVLVELPRRPEVGDRPPDLGILLPILQCAKPPTVPWICMTYCIFAACPGPSIYQTVCCTPPEV